MQPVCSTAGFDSSPRRLSGPPAPPPQFLRREATTAGARQRTSSTRCGECRFLYTMSWRIPLFGSQQQQTDPNFQDIPTQSWYPPSVAGSSSRPSTPTSSSATPHQRASDHPQPSSRGQPSPAEAAGIIARLKDKSIEELQRLLKDKEAYNAFFNSLDQVKTQNNVRDELRKETLQLARENLEKEQRILELRNQCTIIRTTELAAAQDRLTDLERQKDDIMRSYSPAALLDKLQTSMAKLDEESEELHQKFLEKDIDLPTFVQKYKKIRTAYHKQALLHLAGQTSLR
ncbi:vacuolar protein-sorting-associated protein 37 homolog 1 isoform X2 [Setaria viridis]|nr:vacuolar protein-sorting-associated protein 37 homolog 1-like isoform X2 [Setaria viridis]